MAKKSVLSFESRRDHYKAEATVIWCNDDRFTLALQVLAEKMGWQKYDLIKVDGGVKDLAADDFTSATEYLLDQIGKSLKQHQSPTIFLMTHYHCGTYGRPMMESNHEEDLFLTSELQKGKARVEHYLTEIGSSATVRLLLADFKEISEIE